MWSTAFRFMIYDLSKMVGILFGIVISVFLMGSQLGIFGSMTGAAIGIAKFNQKSIWVVNENTQNANQLLLMDARIGRELASIPNITKVSPILVSGGSAKFPNGNKLSVTLIGSKGPDFIGGADILLDGASNQLLFNEGAIIADVADKPTFPNQGPVGTYLQINDHRVYIAAYTKGHAGFGGSNIYTSIERARSLTSIKSTQVSAFLVEFDSTKSTDNQIIQSIDSQIPFTKAYLGKDFADKTLAYMMSTSNIMVSFGSMVLFALIAGFVIVGLTLFSSVNDRIRDYGTIKAMGGNNGLIRKLILYQAFLYATIGFAFAYSLLLMFKMAVGSGRMTISYSPALIAFLIFVTFLISVCGSLFALRKIVKLEPVQIFRM